MSCTRFPKVDGMVPINSVLLYKIKAVSCVNNPISVGMVVPTIMEVSMAVLVEHSARLVKDRN